MSEFVKKRKERYATPQKKSAMIEALTKTLGNCANACKIAGVQRQTHYKWYNSDELYRKKVDEVQETVLDYVESMLLKKISEGDTASIIFYLKTRGKKRGYVEKEGFGEIMNVGDIIVQVVNPKANEIANYDSFSIIE